MIEKKLEQTIEIISLCLLLEMFSVCFCFRFGAAFRYEHKSKTIFSVAAT
jgi:hypothetical protein